MKKRIGKIAVWTMMGLFLAACVATWTLPREAQAATIASRTFALPSTSDVTHSANTYIILWDRATGNLVKDDGTVAAANEWTDGDIATAVHAQNGTVWIATIPALSTNYEYAIAVYDAASPAKTDVPTMGPFLYDPKSASVFSDTNPLEGRSVRTVRDL